MGVTGPTTNRVRLALVGAVRIHRDGLHNLLRDERRIEVVVSASTADEVRAFSDRPEFVVLDVEPPDCYEMASAVLHTIPDIKVLVIGTEDSDDVANSCAGAGICWYFTPQASVADLVSAVSAISSGLMPCSPRIAAALLRQASRRVGDRDLNSGLTQREMEIVGCLRNGLTNKEIARRLGIRIATVKNHVHNILAKLHAKNRNEAASRRPQGDHRVPTEP